MPKLVYLACPYTAVGLCPATILNDRAEAADFFAAELMRQRHNVVFSPVSQGHRIALHLPQTLADSHTFWMKQCTQVLRRCDELVVVPIPGWRQSRGVQYEIDFAVDCQIPVSIIHAHSFDCEEVMFEELHNRHWGNVSL